VALIFSAAELYRQERRQVSRSDSKSVLSYTTPENPSCRSRERDQGKALAISLTRRPSRRSRQVSNYLDSPWLKDDGRLRAVKWIYSGS